MNRALPWVLTTALLVAAWCVALVTPAETVAEQPFVTEAAIGQETTGRNLAVTVRDARAARTVADENGWEAEGHWLVIDLDAAAVTRAEHAIIAGATLTVDDLTFRASERPASLFREQLFTAVPLRGSIAFELPAEAFASSAAELRLSLNADPRADSQFLFVLDFASLEPVAHATLLPIDWADR